MELESGQEILEREERIKVRNLVARDLESVIAVDARSTGRRREEYFKLKLEQNLSETGIKVSLAAEIEGLFCGFLLARVYYGEFGRMEPTAVLDTIGVHPDYQKQGVGAALLRQLRTNLTGLGVPRLQTEVDWDDQDLIAFFHRVGFRPAERFSLELDLTAPTDRGPAR